MTEPRRGDDDAARPAYDDDDPFPPPCPCMEERRAWVRRREARMQREELARFRRALRGDMP